MGRRCLVSLQGESLIVADGNNDRGRFGDHGREHSVAKCCHVERPWLLRSFFAFFSVLHRFWELLSFY